MENQTPIFLISLHACPGCVPYGTALLTDPEVYREIHADLVMDGLAISVPKGEHPSRIAISGPLVQFRSIMEYKKGIWSKSILDQLQSKMTLNQRTAYGHWHAPLAGGALASEAARVSAVRLYDWLAQEEPRGSEECIASFEWVSDHRPACLLQHQALMTRDGWQRFDLIGSKAKVSA